MRVLHVVPELLPCPPVLGGGVERLVAEWAQALSRRGIEVHIASPRAPLWPAAEMDWDGVRVHPLPAGSYREAVAELAWEMVPDIVHVHNRPGWVIDLPRPVVVSLHNPPAGWLEPAADRHASRDAVAASLPSAAALLPVSQWLARLLPVWSRVQVVSGHVDVETFVPGRARWRRTLVFAGKLDPKKGLEVTLDALDHLDGWRLVVCSPLPPVTGFEAWQVAVLERIAADRRVSLLLPRLERAAFAAVLAAASVVVVPSVGDEALGLISPEAQSCGTPVVVSDSGGLPETVLDGQTGFVVPKGDSLALAAAVRRVPDLTGDPRRFVMSEFLLAERIGQLERVYARVP